MSSFDDPEEKQPKKKSRRSRSGRLWNILTLVILVFTFCLCGYFMTVFLNPQTPMNPFPPLPMVARLVLPTATWTPIPLEPTWTHTPTIAPTLTPTSRPTFTTIPTNTPFVLITNTPAITDTVDPNITPTKSISATPTAKPTSLPFSADVKYIDSTIMHPDKGCDWTGVGGSVVDASNAPVFGTVISLKGTFNGSAVSQLSVSGTAPLYGTSGFEFYLGDTAIDSTGLLEIQLLDQGGLPLAPTIKFDTYSDCAKNLVLIQFKGIK